MAGGDEATPAMDAVVKQLEGADLGFDKEAWLEDKEPYMRKRFEELFKTQDVLDKYFDQLQKERHALEQKYIQLCEPLMESRNRIVRGEDVPPGGEGDTKGIPCFWEKVLSSHEVFEDAISDKDREVLKAMQEIKLERSEETHNGKPRHIVKLLFVFGDNPFFEEKELTKSYYFHDQDEQIADHSEGCTITWKEGKDATKKYLKKKDGAGWKHKVTPVQSVFSFFAPPKVPAGKLSIEESDSLEEAMEMDFALGAAVSDDILPNALKYFTGQAQMEATDSDYDPDDDEEDDDDDDDDDEDDDDDDDAAAPPPKGDGECKQQ